VSYTGSWEPLVFFFFLLQMGFCHIYNLMLNSGKIICSSRDKQKNILTLVLSEKKILKETKNQNPTCRLNGRTLLDFFKFRTSNHKLPIECGRWQNIERNRRLCKLCQKEEICDEFHYIMECPFFNPNMIKVQKFNDFQI
jgi:hypothetical protein